MPFFNVQHRYGPPGSPTHHDSTHLVRARSIRIALAQFAPPDWPVLKKDSTLIAYAPPNSLHEHHRTDFLHYWCAYPCKL